uniref:Uncharacterized protein n=1 Tax=Arundo donax TaxID=35708 RepID=A0A0A9G2F1_ARUDO
MVSGLCLIYLRLAMLRFLLILFCIMILIFPLWLYEH